eukprot:TRINITY_DN12225_c5_g4_i1.p2 TRINITY_DN12225_c5_g4~~TRINITY_DN12225_c5_g4_i1.p2  ORF type:complete len:131 (+),score=18.08 TRINITY_DN12225_c5_g4_i1:788-1180(+)
MAYSAILERSLIKPRCEISTSSFALLFAEIVRYSHARVATTSELETKLAQMGKRVGHRFAELLLHRERNNKREVKVISILILVQTTLWKMLFGKAAEGLSQMDDEGHKCKTTLELARQHLFACSFDVLHN